MGAWEALQKRERDRQIFLDDCLKSILEWEGEARNKIGETEGFYRSLLEIALHHLKMRGNTHQGTDDKSARMHGSIMPQGYFQATMCFETIWGKISTFGRTLEEKLGLLAQFTEKHLVYPLTHPFVREMGRLDMSKPELVLDPELMKETNW